MDTGDIETAGGESVSSGERLDFPASRRLSSTAFFRSAAAEASGSGSDRFSGGR
jgi:hypothetical protein